jgi:hypothetical protein
MCRSVDNVDAGGFALLAAGAGLSEDEGVDGAEDDTGFDEADDVEAAGLLLVGFGGSGFLENIVCSLHIVSCI